MPLSLCITLALRQALTTKRPKLIQLLPYVQAPRIVHIHDAHPSLDLETCQTLSALLIRTFRGLLVSHGLDILCSHAENVPQLARRRVEGVGVGLHLFHFVVLVCSCLIRLQRLSHAAP